MILRHLCLDYGKKYYLRLQSLFSVILLITITSIIYLVLGEMKVFKVQDPTRWMGYSLLAYVSGIMFVIIGRGKLKTFIVIFIFIFHLF